MNWFNFYSRTMSTKCEVKCSMDSGLESIIISLVDDVETAASILTTLFNNGATADAKSVASGTPSTQIEASERAISFSTVVTNAYLTGDDDTLTYNLFPLLYRIQYPPPCLTDAVRWKKIPVL